MYNRIVTEPMAMIRTKARNALNGRWKQGILGIMLYYFLTISISDILDIVINKRITLEPSLITGTEPIEVGVFSYLYDIFTTPLFTFGLISFVFILMTTKTARYSSIFDGFGIYLKVFLMSVIMGAKILLWSLLLIVPGIIAAINYSQSYFILAEDPTKGINQCIKESIQLMRGNKLSFIFLNLSYIGWYVLGFIASAFIAIPMAFLPKDGFEEIFMNFISYLPIGVALLYAYMGLAQFYQLTKPLQGSYSDIFYEN